MVETLKMLRIRLEGSKMVGIPCLQSADQRRELRKAAQICQTWVFQKERPAGEACGDATLQPIEGGLKISDKGESARDLVVRVVRMPERFRVRASPGHTVQRSGLVAHERVKHTLETDDQWIIRHYAYSLVHQSLRFFPVRTHHRGIRSEVEGIFIARTFGTPDFKVLARKIPFLSPDINLHDTGADCFLRLKGTSALEHFAGMLEQSDVRQDCAQTVVRMRQIRLQGNRSLQFANRFQMLEVLRRTPQQESACHMALG